MNRIIIAAFTLTLAWAATGSAQVRDTPGRSPCLDCQKADADATALREKIKSRNAELDRLQQEQRTNNGNLNNVRQLRLQAAGDNNQAAVEEYDQSINDLQADNSASREQQFKTQEEIRTLTEQLDRIGRDVDACKEKCGDFTRDLPTGTNVTPSTGEIGPGNTPTPSGVSAPPLKLPPCDDCREGVPELEKQHKELQRRAERANATGDPEALRDFEQQRRKVRDLQRQVDDCNKVCKPKTTASLRDPRLIGGVVGGVTLFALVTGGGGNRPVIAQTPVVTPQETTTNQPTSDSFNGRWIFIGTANENRCLLPPSMQGTVDVAVNSSGNGPITMQATSGAPGQPPEQYVFTNGTLRMNGNQGSVEAETASSQFLRVIIQFTFVNPLTGQISFFRDNCHTGLNVNGTRQ